MNNTGNDVILGKDYSNGKRALAYLSIVIIYFFYCYNFMIGTFTKPTMIAAVADGGLGFTLKESEEIFAYMSFGTIPGTFIFGKISTKIGKKRTLILIAALIAITTYLPLLSPTNLMLWKLSRTAAGAVLGATFGCAMPLVADMFPTKYRGKLAASLTTTFSLAMIFGGWLYGKLGNSNWEMLVYTAVIPPIIGGVMSIFFVPDDYEYTKQLNAAGKETGEKVSYLGMYKGKYLWIGILAIVLSGLNFTAYSCFNNNATTFLVNTMGMSAAKAGAVYSVEGIGLMIGYIFWGTISDKIGRKVPIIGMALCTISVFVFTKLGADNSTGFYLTSLLFGFAAGYSGAWGAYYTELFPTKFRALSAGMSFNGGRIISMFAIPAVAGLGMGAKGMLPIFTVAMVVFGLGCVVWALLPETIRAKQDSKE